MMMISLGVDVSKKKLDGHRLGEELPPKGWKKTVTNDAQGFTGLLKWVQNKSGCDPNQIHIVMEATGPYHELFAQAMYEAGCRVSVVNPARVKHFARGEGIRTKNDKIDAYVLALYGLRHPEQRRWQPEVAEYRQLKALLKRQEAIEMDLRRERNRLEKIPATHASTEVLESHQRSIAFLEQELHQLKQHIELHVQQHPTLQKDCALLTSIPGVGTVVALIMVALLQHGQRFESASQAAAYLGLIPIEAESGTSVRHPARLSKTGPAPWRAKLYMPAIVASQHNPDVRALYLRLLARGKSKMAALGAAMRKLVHICFGVIKHQTVYQPQIATLVG